MPFIPRACACARVETFAVRRTTTRVRVEKVATRSLDAHTVNIASTSVCDRARIIVLAARMSPAVAIVEMRL